MTQPNPLYIDSAAVAALLGLDGARPSTRFLSRRTDLEAQGFPAPVCWARRPLMWDRSAVEAWIAASRQLAAQGEAPRAGLSENDAAFARAMVQAKLSEGAA